MLYYDESETVKKNHHVPRMLNRVKPDEVSLWKSTYHILEHATLESSLSPTQHNTTRHQSTQLTTQSEGMHVKQNLVHL